MRWPVAVLYASLRIAGRLPLRVLHAFGATIGRVLWLVHGKARRHAEINIALVLPELDSDKRRKIAYRALLETGRSITEVAKVWDGRPDRALGMVVETRGVELLDHAIATKRGVIIAAPHLGCWELLNYWLAARTDLAIVYRPPRHAGVEPFLRRARGALAVEQVRAEGAGVRALYRRLQAGGVVGILPDQQPKQGEGVFAPFFGIEALTMVLVPRLAARTGATVLFAFAERLPNARGFRVHVLPSPPAIADEDLRVACSALNRGVEDCVRVAFEQYQWHYKRFQYRPFAADRNPYWRGSDR